MRLLRAIAVALALPAAAAQDSGPARDPSEHRADAVPPRARVAGIDSLWVVSRVTFASAELDPHRLECAFAFPARARVALRREGGAEGERVLRYRRGAAAYGIGPGESASTEFAAGERAEEILQLEARLAVIVWPEAHAWTGGGDSRRVEIEGAGALVATLEPASPGPDGSDAGASDGEASPRRLAAITSLDLEGRPIETLEVLARRVDERGRAWPRTLRLRAGDRVVWSEEIVELDRNVRWSDAWFVPPDRRDARGSVRERVVAVDLPGGFVCEEPLPPGLDLVAAVAEAERRRDALARGAEPRIAEASVRLGSDLAPQATRLAIRADPPSGAWRAVRPAPGWSAFLDGLAEVDARRLRELTAARRSAGETAEPVVLLELRDDAPAGFRLVVASEGE